MPRSAKPVAPRERNKIRNFIIDQLKSQGFTQVKLGKPKGGKFMAFQWDDAPNGVHETLTTTARRIRNYTLEKWLDEGLYFCKMVTAGRYPKPVQQPMGSTS